MVIRTLLISAVFLLSTLGAALPAAAQRGGGGHGGGGFHRGGGAMHGGGFNGGGFHGGSVRFRGGIEGRGFRGGNTVFVPRGNFGHVGRPFFPSYNVFVGRGFRPHTNLGFGLWLGYPGPYFHGYAYPFGYASPYGYAYPYGYASPYNSYTYSQDYTYSPPVNVTAATGGVSFSIVPPDAQVHVDGVYVGQAGDFTPASRPLDLTSGRHRVEVTATGYEPMTFDLDVVAGQVLPIEGSLRVF